MKPKLIFINLLIDSLWSQNSLLDRVFNVKGPDAMTLARSNEFFGRFFANPGDLVVVPVESASNSYDQELELTRKFLTTFPVKWIEIKTSLQDTDVFSANIISKSQSAQVGRGIFAGPSPLELSVVNGLSLESEISKMNLEQIKLWNRKDSILELGKALNIKIPNSEIVTENGISSSKHLYKSLVSSGGSGVFTSTDMEMIKSWADKKNLLKELAEFRWLKQELIERRADFNCFGHTDAAEFNCVKITYDKSRLSYRHEFNQGLDADIESSLKETFSKVHQYLIRNGYSGPFGFDSIVSVDGNVFPIVDLNVRLNKSHILNQVVSRIKNKKECISFFRIRFINDRWPLFASFWNSIVLQINSSLNINTEVFPVDWSFWKMGKSEFTFVVNTDNAEDCVKVANWVEMLNRNGMSHD